MPSSPADLTLMKLNSALGGVGAEWGSDEGPAGAKVSQAVRSQARNLGNAGQPGEAAELLLSAALQSRVPLSAALLDEVDRNLVPVSANGAALAQLVANLRGVAATPGAAGGKKPGLFGRLFGKK